MEKSQERLLELVKLNVECHDCKKLIDNGGKCKGKKDYKNNCLISKSIMIS